MYDVVNILEAVQMVKKRGKNTYAWMGRNHLNAEFALLQREGLAHFAADARTHGLLPANWSDDDDNNGNDQNKNSNQDTNAAPKPQKRLPECLKDCKSLTRLSQHFLQLFLVGHPELSLPDASDKIHGRATLHQLAALGSKGRASESSVVGGEGGTAHASHHVVPFHHHQQQQPSTSPVVEVPDPLVDLKKFHQAAARGLKTKIRRLYDIANVFRAVGILRKIEGTTGLRSDRDRPTFAWAHPTSPHDLARLYESLPDTVKLHRSPFDEPVRVALEERPNPGSGAFKIATELVGAARLPAGECGRDEPSAPATNDAPSPTPWSPPLPPSPAARRVSLLPVPERRPSGSRGVSD